MSSLHQVAPAYVCQLWPKVKEMLANALEHSGGEYTVDQLQFMLVRGEQTLLVIVDENENVIGAISVAFQHHPAQRIAFVTAVGGRFITSPELWDQFEHWCRENGATHIRGAAYAEVARLWRQKFGVEQRYIIVEKAL
jgi:hypothetical protein